MNATDWMNDLKAKADAATQGEWYSTLYSVVRTRPSARDIDCRVISDSERGNYINPENNAAYIAAANPQTVKRLIAMLNWFARDESCTMVCPMPEDYACKHKIGEDCTHSGTKDCEHCWLQAAYEDTEEKKLTE